MSKFLYIVGIDGSEWSERAVERAVHLAEDTSATVKLIYALQWPSLTPISVGGIEPFGYSREDEVKRVQDTILTPLIDKFSDTNVTLENEITFGDPVHELSKKVKNEHANMLFVGRRGRSVFGDLVLGSVANKLAHVVGVPIVLVP